MTLEVSDLIDMLKRLGVILFISITCSMLFEFNIVLCWIWFGFGIISVVLFVGVCNSLINFKWDGIINDNIRRKVKYIIDWVSDNILIWGELLVILYVASFLFHENFELFNIGHSNLGNFYIYLNIIWLSFFVECYYIVYCCVEIHALKKFQDRLKEKGKYE